MFDRFRNRPDNNLTPELAGQNPEVYVQRVIEVLKDKSYLGNKVIRFLGGISIKLNKDNGISENLGTPDDNGPARIKLSSVPWSEKMKALTMFENEAFDYESEIAYKLVHELSHNLAFLLAKDENDPLANLLQTTFSNRQKTGLGFSALGSLEFYREKGADKQTTEDLTELIAMYVWDPEYLKRFLKLISDPKYKEYLRGEIKIQNIDTEGAKNIFNLISESVEKLVREDTRSGTPTRPQH